MSRARFDRFMAERKTHAGNQNKVRPLRSSRWKTSFPGHVPLTHRWHEKNTYELEGALSNDASTISAIYRPFEASSREKRQRSRGSTRRPHRSPQTYAESLGSPPKPSTDGLGGTSPPKPAPPRDSLRGQATRRAAQKELLGNGASRRSTLPPGLKL